MQAYRRSFIVQLVLFVIFFLMGANTIVSYYFTEQAPWLNYVVLALLIGLGVLGFMIYKKKDTSIVLVTKKEIDTLKYLLYGYFGVYILQMFTSNVESIPKDVLAISTGVVLMGIAAFGVYLHYRILKK